MTALTKYLRLEASALWRDDPDAQRRDVILSLGDATLMISDKTGTALSHWSLPAIERRNPGQRPAIFAPGRDAAETLEIEDEEMIDAISTVREAIRRRQPQRGRLRGAVVAGVLLALGALAVFWLPDALIRHTAGVVPQVKRAEIDRRLVTALTRIAGQPCRSRNGTRALARLDRRLGGDGEGLTVLAEGVSNAVLLPGGRVLLNHQLVEDYETSDVVAGYIIAARQRQDRISPMEEMLDAVGLRAAVRLLTTGDLRESTLARYARMLATRPEPPREDDEALLDAFRTIGVPSSPYAYAVDFTGETTLPLIEADPVPADTASPLLTPEDWAALQRICEG